MRIFILSVFTLFLSWSTGWAQELSLLQTTQFTLKNSTELLEVDSESRISSAWEEQAQAFPNPELEFEHEASENLTTVGVSQLLELGGKRSYRTQIAFLQKEKSVLRVEEKQRDLIREATQRFGKLWGVYQRLQLVEQLEHLSKEVFDTVSERVRAGKDSPSIQTQARIDWLSIKLKRRHAKADLEQSKNDIALLWGGETLAFESVEPLETYLVFPPSYDTLLPYLENSPFLKQLQLETQIQQKTIALEKSQNTPDVTVHLGAQQSQGETGGVLGISMPLTFFDRNQGEIMSATINTDVSVQKRRVAEKELQLKFKQAYLALQNTFEDATLLKSDLLPSAKEVFQAVKEGYQAGKFEYLEMLHAQKTYVEIQQSYLDSIENYIHSKAEVEHFIGINLNKITDQEVP